MTSTANGSDSVLRRATLILVTAGISLFLCLLMAEVTVRVLKRNTAFQPDPDLIRSRIPNKHEFVSIWETDDNLNGRSTEIPRTATPVGDRPTNNLGFRMADNVDPKAPGERRLLVLGDSFQEALDVPYDRRFDSIALRLLRQHEGWKDWRIINAAIQNGSPSQYVLMLPRLLPQVEPDMVIVVTGSNDLGDDMQWERDYGFVFDERGVPIRPRRWLMLWALQKSYLLRYAYVLVNQSPMLDRFFPAAEPSLQPLNWMTLSCTLRPEAVASFERRTGHYLVRLQQMAAEAGVPFGVVVIHYLYSFPNEPFYEPRYPSMRSDLARERCYETNAQPYSDLIDGFLARNAVPYQDTRDAFNEAKRQAPNRKLWNFYDYHFSPRGHEVLGAELAAFAERIAPARS